MSDGRSALIGGIAGGILGVLGSLGVAALGIEQAATAEGKRATGAARLLVADLRRAEGDFANSLTDCRYELYDENVELPADDLSLVAWRLEPQQWLPVAEAISRLKVQVGRSRVRHQFVHDDVTQIEYVIKLIDRAGPSLDGLSGEKLFTGEQVTSALAHVGASCSKA